MAVEVTGTGQVAGCSCKPSSPKSITHSLQNAFSPFRQKCLKRFAGREGMKKMCQVTFSVLMLLPSP